MNHVYRALGLFLVTVVMVCGVRGQESTKTQTAEPASAQTTNAKTTDSKTTNSDYVFPTRRERFNRYVLRTVGPEALLRSGASAGFSQWRDSPEEWGQGAEGYGKRFASSMGRNAIQQSVVYGLDSALHLDTGFKRSKREGFGARLKDALLQNVTSRNRSGNRVFSVPRFAGVYTGAIVASETWYPERYSYKDGLRQGTTTLLTGFGINVVREFLINW
jgi:hypothetical protein